MLKLRLVGFCALLTAALFLTGIIAQPASAAPSLSTNAPASAARPPAEYKGGNHSMGSPFTQGFRLGFREGFNDGNNACHQNRGRHFAAEPNQQKANRHGTGPFGHGYSQGYVSGFREGLQACNRK